MGAGVWAVRLSASAERDYQQILRWTAEHFGILQAQTYADTLSAALLALGAGPALIGAKARPDIGENIHTLHVARHGHKGRHFVVFRVANTEPDTMDVLRLLHDSMDVAQHLPRA